MQQPADVHRELLRFRSRQQHAVVQRMQEPALADPALLLDQNAVHHRDLPGRPAEAERGDLRPDPYGLTERDVVTG